MVFHSSDDIDYRGSTTTLYQPGTASHSTSQVHPPPSLPWLGSGQTSTGATVVCLLSRHMWFLGMGSSSSTLKLLGIEVILKMRITDWLWVSLVNDLFTYQPQFGMDVTILQYHFIGEQTETQNGKAKSKRGSCLFILENCLRLLKINSSWSLVEGALVFHALLWRIWIPAGCSGSCL